MPATFPSTMGRAGPLIRHGPPHETSWNGLPLRATRTSPTATEWLLGPWEYDDRGNVAFESEGGIHHADQPAGSLLTDIVHLDCLWGTCDEDVAREERSYDGLGRLVDVLGPYDPAVVGPDVVTTSTWSDAGRLWSVEDALGQRTRCSVS